jgi:signal transduction histidine kinase
MKIKHWLMISYFIVMLVPVASLYLLYVSISGLDQKRDFLEYIEVTERLSELESRLEKPSLYAIQPAENYTEIEKIASESVKISLYRPDGVILYTSLQEPSMRLFRENTEQLFKNLNEIQKQHRTYTVKKPVLQDGQIIGIYEMTFGREKWVEGVNHRYILLGTLFSAFFILVYIVVVILLNRKLNRPLRRLTMEMSAFAQGQTLPDGDWESAAGTGAVFWRLLKRKTLPGGYRESDVSTGKLFRRLMRRQTLPEVPPESAAGTGTLFRRLMRRKTLPENHLKPHDEIGELLLDFKKMKQQIEETQKELAKQHKEKEFIVAALSHDLKTPLTVIRAYSEALHMGSLTVAERQEYREILFEKLEYMRQLLDDLAMYTALQSSSQTAELVEVEGEEFFDMLLSGYEEPCSKKGIILTVQQAVEGIYHVDARQMVRIVDNLMGNGIRHTGPGKSLWLAVVSSQCPLPNWVFPPFFEKINKWRLGGTVILIQNEGKAIPVEQQESVFEPFVQGEGARGLGGSSGLGLSIAKMLVEKHGGEIRLWSADGYGTVFACWLQER